MASLGLGDSKSEGILGLCGDLMQGFEEQFGAILIVIEAGCILSPNLLQEKLESLSVLLVILIILLGRGVPVE